ncbi:MAG: hypothetical protein ABEL76_08295 [Bradymonadaceae bacterium]
MSDHPRHPRFVLALAALVLLGWLVGSACKPQYVRGSEKEDLDKQAMSLKLDRKDLQRLYKKNKDKLLNSSIVQQWNRQAREKKPPVVAIFPMRNETNQSLAVDALLSKFETDLVNKTQADVISHERQSELIAEVKRQQKSSYNQQRLAEYGKQLGAQYFVTGKIYGVREQVKKEKRQQYFMSVQVINVATGVIEFQNEEGITKGYVK